MKKTIQYFDDDYLQRCKDFSTGAILDYLENFRLLQQATTCKSRLISIKVPEPLLAQFKAWAELNGIKYQTQIKQLMAEWLKS